MITVETLRVVHFDSARTVLAINCYPGDATKVTVPIRQIVADALRLGSTGLLLSHNHPSGDPTPSRADVSATHMLARAAAALEIIVHDHLIFGAGRRISFRALGLL